MATRRGMSVALVVSLGLCLGVAGSASAGPGQDDDRGTPLDRALWVAGDVHVHSAGDGSLRDNLVCKAERRIPQSGSPSEDEKAACAGFLIDQVIGAAKANGLSWAVLSEHGVWLGVNSTDASLPELTDYSEAEARSEWSMIRDIATSKSVESGVRLLIGEEMGSAEPITGAGHFSTYYSPDYIADSPFLRSEGEFLRAAQDARGWGAINHPGTGSTWGCWTDDDKSARQTNLRPCPDGVADDHPGEVRAVEVYTGDIQEPPQPVLDRWDELLVRGLKVAAVGGGDTHSVRRPGPLEDGTSAGSQTTGNLDRLGSDGRARTYVMRPSVSPDGDYRSDLVDDPVRDAITRGETLASNGPWVGMTIDGAGPDGQNYLPNAETHRLRLSWDPGLGTPTSIRLVLGQVPDPSHGCKPGADKKFELSDCVKTVDIPTEPHYGGVLPDPVLQIDHTFRTSDVFPPATDEADDGFVTTESPMFVRVEMRFGGDHGVFSSPFYLQGASLTTGRY